MGRGASWGTAHAHMALRHTTSWKAPWAVWTRSGVQVCSCFCCAQWTVCLRCLSCEAGHEAGVGRQGLRPLSALSSLLSCTGGGRVRAGSVLDTRESRPPL